MAAMTPLVHNGRVISRSMGDVAIADLLVGSPQWYVWLDEQRIFRFVDEAGRFTARKERRPGGMYWYAYRRVQGVLHTGYLGRSRDLTYAWLCSVAQQLVLQTTPSASPNTSAGSLLSDDMRDSPVLLSKLAIPRPRARLLPRPQLCLRLDRSSAHALTVLSAPAGFGKTTLLGTWAHARTLPVAWLSLDTTDNDPRRFWRYVTAALATCYAEIDSRLAPVLNAATIPTALSLLVNSLATFSGDLTLILDDYHVIDNPEIHQTVNFLLEHLPAQFHVMIAGRSDPPLHLASLRVARELLEVRTDDLRFVADETVAFVEHYTDLQLTSEDLALLQARTEGWVAMVQLAVQALQDAEDPAALLLRFGGQHRFVVDYLVQEVIQRQPPSIQRFLLYTSILDRLNASLCDAVMESESSEQWLGYLELTNVFVFALDHPGWYQYHQLFADVQRYRLQQMQPERVSELHRRAARWYEQQGMAREAVEHALFVSDTALVVRLLVPLAEILLVNGEIDTVRRWLDRLPRELAHTHPYLSCLQACLLLVQANFAAVEPWLLDAERELAVDLDTDAESTLRIHGIIAVARSTVASNFGDVQYAIIYAHRAMKLLGTHEHILRGIVLLNLADAYEWSEQLAQAEKPYIEAIALQRASDNIFVMLTTLAGLASLQQRQGRLRQAYETYHETLQIAREQAGPRGGLLPSAGKALVFLAELLYQWNDLETALRTVCEGLVLCQQWTHLVHTVQGYLVAARLYWALQKSAEALEQLRLARLLIEQAQTTHRRSRAEHPNANIAYYSDQVTAQLLLFQIDQRDLTSVQQWLQERGWDLDHPPQTYLFVHVMIKWLLARHQPEQALSLIVPWLQWASERCYQHERIELLLFQALAYQMQGRTSNALDVLLSALERAESEHYLRIFIDKGPTMQRLLQQITPEPRSMPYLQRILAAFAPPIASQPVLPVEKLTERELTILRLLIDGKTNREIAETLFLTLGTIKWYLHNIYGKLGVRSRTQAIVETQRRQLLS